MAMVLNFPAKGPPRVYAACSRVAAARRLGRSWVPEQALVSQYVPVRAWACVKRCWWLASSWTRATCRAVARASWGVTGWCRAVVTGCVLWPHIVLAGTGARAASFALASLAFCSQQRVRLVCPGLRGPRRLRCALRSAGKEQDLRRLHVRLHMRAVGWWGGGQYQHPASLRSLQPCVCTCACSLPQLSASAGVQVLEDVQVGPAVACRG